MASPSTLEIQIDSHARLFPAPSSAPSPPSPHHVPLSILDSTVAGFSAASACWIYDAPPPSPSSPLATTLAQALRVTLCSYPHLSGQLHYSSTPFPSSTSPTNPPSSSPILSQDHTQRYKRITISYNTPTDPGVEFVVAHSPLSLSHFLPSLAERCGDSTKGIWEAGKVPTKDLLPLSPSLAFHDLSEWEGLPCMIAQVTTFACGGVAVAAKVLYLLSPLPSASLLPPHF
jgi:hypothetical protein